MKSPTLNNIKEPIDIGKINWVNYYFKTGYKIAFEYKGWGHLMEAVKHKRGRKPLGFQFYSDRGICLLEMELPVASKKG